MIKEISNFMESVPSGLKGMGIKPKKGIHVLLGFQKERDTLFMNEKSIRKVCYTGNAKETDFSFLQQCAGLAQVAWCVNTNKCFDLPTKGIHSCSPYCIAFKKESLEGGGKYEKDKIKIYERIGSYFDTAFALLDDPKEVEKLTVFRNFINTKEKIEKVFSSFQSEFDALKESEYLIFYLDEPQEKYLAPYEKYLADKLFNTNDYNLTVEEEVFGTSDFLNGFPTKKPFLTHQTALFEVAGRVSGREARNLYDFQDIMNRNIFPRPLPIFIYEEELKKDLFELVKQDVEEGKRTGYKTIMEDLYRNHENDLTNYYLLFYLGGMVKDFDFVPKFRYKLNDGKEEGWIIKDYFNGNKGIDIKIDNVFDLEYKVLQRIFNNALVVQTKTGGFQYKYFDEIDPAYCKTENTYLLVMKYRKAFYDYVYKSKQQAVTEFMVHDILLTGILDDMRLDKYENKYHSERRNILQKLNILFSLSECFNAINKKIDRMGNRIQEHRDFMAKLVQKEVFIENDEQYAFVIGQILVYLASKSMTNDRSYKYLEPFLRQSTGKQLTEAVSKFFEKYKHATYSTKFKEPFAQAMDYGIETSVKDIVPFIMAGIFSPNLLFSKQDLKEVEEEQESEE